jgi:type I restriction enzyme S subunit
MSNHIPAWKHVEYIETTWGELVELRYGKGLKEYKDAVGEYPVYGTNGAVGYCDNPLCEFPSVIIGRKGAYRGVHYSDKPFYVIDTAYFVVPKYDINLKWVYYSLLTKDINGLDSGSAIPSTRREDFYAMTAIIPPRIEQDKIVTGLDYLNAKIELNRQTNQTLEQIAQAIFKSWFVDFEPVKAKVAALSSLSPWKRAGVRGQELAEQAAICAISGKAPEQLAQLDSQILQQIKSTAALFPDALVDSELWEIPEGWEISCIDDVCNFQNGYAFQSQEMSKIGIDSYKVFKMGGIKKGGGLNRDSTKDWYEKTKCEKLDRYIIKKGDLLMCMTDMKNNVALLGHTALMDVDDEYILNQRVGLLRTKNKNIANYPFLYILTNSDFFIEDLRSRANSGVQVNLSTKEIKETKFVLPNEKVHAEFDKLAIQLQEKIFSLEAEQDYLSELRDSLLPKLLSGEITLTNQDEAA